MSLVQARTVKQLYAYPPARADLACVGDRYRDAAAGVFPGGGPVPHADPALLRRTVLVQAARWDALQRLARRLSHLYDRRVTAGELVRRAVDEVLVRHT